MKVYRVRIDMDRYNYFVGDINEDMFNGESLENTWHQNNKVKLSGKNKKNGDFKDYIATVYSCNDKTKIILEPILKNDVEFLKLDYEENYWVMNCLNIIDAIDYKKAKPSIVSNKYITYFIKYAFKKELLEDELLFKIPEFAVTSLYCTEKFKEVIESNNITAIYFEEIWDSESDK